MPILTVPLLSLVSMAILVQCGRQDLAGYALVASLLMNIGQMGFFVGSEIITLDRRSESLELLVASPASYVVVLVTRILVLTSVGMIGFLESWVMVRLVFEVHVTIFYPAIMAATVIATIFAATATSVVTCALFSLARNTRTFQSAINGPLYLLGGVLVPVTYLPTWLQPASRGVFFYWSAELLRGSMSPAPPEGVVLALSAIVALGVSAGAIGILVVRVMLDNLRRNGTMSLT